MAEHSSEWLPANADISPHEVTVGTTVFGSDGKEIGRVKEVLADRFLVDRQFRRDLYLPFDRVQGVQMTRLNKRLVLDVPSDGVDEVASEPPQQQP